MVVNNPGRRTVRHASPESRTGPVSLAGVLASAVAGTKTTVSPAANRAGGDTAGSNTGSSARPMICQPPGEAAGYTPVCRPAIPTDPQGTDRRGDARRGMAIDRSTRPMYANPG